IEGGGRMHTSNGAVRMLNIRGDLDVQTSFEVRLRGAISQNHLEGTIGPGGPMLDLSTSNGSIRLLKL
ncbi:MAG TPA: hypothetical protein VGC99_23180, partial [Candidatus Tectomicrobia bacterium]